MNKITIILLIAFLCLTVWTVYECLEHFFGARIRANLKESRDMKAAFKLYEANELARKLKIAKGLEIEEVEVEEVEGLCSAVTYYTEGGQKKFSTELIIINE